EKKTFLNRSLLFVYKENYSKEFIVKKLILVTVVLQNCKD
ncbi:hypothetical protein IGA_04679, partial [Bacillus cereus HuA3-9]